MKNLNFFNKKPRCSLPTIPIPPLLLFINTFFEVLTLILLFTENVLEEKDFLLWIISVIILMMMTIVLLAYFPKKIDAIYPFHNFLLSFLIAFLFSSQVSTYSQNIGLAFFLGFLAGFFQCFSYLQGALISGTLSLLISFLFYFFYFVKGSGQPLAFTYYFICFFYLILMKFQKGNESGTSEAETYQNNDNISDRFTQNPNEIMNKLINNIFPGMFFLLSFDKKALSQMKIGTFFDSKTFHEDQHLEISPSSEFEKYSSLVYANGACLESGLEKKAEFFEALENIEICYIYKKMANNMDENPKEESLEEKDSELIVEENKKKNLLFLIKSRFDVLNQNALEMETKNEEQIVINGYISYKKMNKKPIKLHLSLFENNKKYYLFCYFSDIAVDEDLANLKETSRLKDQMLANVAHDLRSPITGIIAFINQSLEANRSEREKLLEYAKINANLLLHLVGDILDFSQIKKGILNLVVKTFSLKELLDQILNLMRYQAEMKHIKLILEYTLSKDVVMESDDRRICQLLVNLLSNAIKFTMKGSVTLKISSTFYNNLLKFEVKDTGIGIKPQLVPHLFKPFATFSDKTLNNKYGIGLGLSICKMVASLLGPSDRLYVSSEYGKGALFGFLLYTKVEQAQQPSPNINVNKKIWEKKELKITTKKVNLNLIAGSTVNPRNNFNISPLKRKTLNNHEDECLISSSLSPYKFESEHCNEMNLLDMKEKIDISDYFKEEEKIDFSIRLSENNNENEEKKEKNDEKTAFKPTQVILSSENRELTDHLSSVNNINNEDEERRKMKKVFSYNLGSTPKVRMGDKPGGLVILIVDDNPFNILILNNYLKKISNCLIFQVFSAMNGEQACAIFEQHNKSTSKTPIDIVFMDCQMPIMNGYDATSYIKDKINNKGYIKTIVVAITAYCDEASCLQCGMDAYLLKPVSEKDFLDIFDIFAPII